jgi:DNA-binding winged helix-turn-helix (wHTH) protein/tetratricopeptide (TPR) repeat protein
VENRGRNFRFGPFSLNSQERVLSRNGTRVDLRGQPYQILEVLLARAGKLVTRDEIRETLWPGETFVDFEHGLNSSVKKLRQALGDSAEQPSYIETVRGFGYRFVAPVEVEVVEAPAPEPVAPIAPVSDQGSSAEAPALHDASRRIGRGWFASMILLVAVSFLGVAFYLYRAHQQKKRLTQNDTVVLADFANSTGDPVFDDTLKTALRITLRQSPFLNLVSDRTVAQTLQLMTRPAGTRLTPEIARDLCMRAGSKAYIAGAIGSLGSEYVLELSAVNCLTGDTLAKEQVTAESRQKVLDALGEAASRLRGKLGESLTTVERFDVPLEEATTPSLEALKALSLGTIAANQQGVAAALPWHQRAIELDPNFAMGYRTVGGDYYELGEVARAGEYLTRAFQLRQRTSEREELEIAAAYYRNVTGELDQAAQTLEKEIANYPRDWRAYSTLGAVFVEQGQYEKAAAITRQAMPLTPDKGVLYGNLANDTLALQRFDETRQAIRDAQALKGLDDYPLHESLYALAFIAGDSAGMAQQQKWFASKPQFENFGLALASDTEAYTGHLARARELTRQAVDSAVRADDKENASIWEAIGAQREAAYGDPAEARRMAAAALKLAPTSQGMESETALAFAMAGEIGEAQSLAQDLGKRFPLDTQMQSIWLPAIQAQAALAYRNPAAAVHALQPASSVEFGQILFVLNVSCLYPAYVRGEAYLEAGQGTAAATEFQKILDHSGMVWNCWTGPMARLGVARANALQSRTAQGPEADAARARAVAAYRDFLTLWKDADSEIPVLKEAKAEFAKLQ